MRRVLCVMYLFSWLTPGVGAELVVLADQAAVRQAADSNSSVLTTVAHGGVLTRVERRDNWWRVDLPDGRPGWVFTALVGPAEQLKTRGEPNRADLDELVGDYWLLSIGMDQYTHWPKLENAVHDAKAVVEVLSKHYGFKPNRIVELYDKHATEDNIINTFIDLQAKLKPNDSLLIYYAGHGIIDNFKTGSWIPVNAREGQVADYISTDRLTRMMSTLPAKHIFLVADACFSGSLFGSRGARRFEESDRYFRENVKRSSRQALTSGGMEEVADGGAEGHSIFAHHFLQELRHNEAPYFAASALSASVEQLVARNASQEPRWSHLREAGDEDGEFFFLRATAPLPAIVASNGPRQLQVSSDPDGARVLIDGEMVGVTPLSLGGLVGRVVVTVTKEGFDTAGENVMIRLDRTQNLSFNLTPVAGAGQLSITSDPDDAAWYVDGDLMGKTPDQVASLGLGRHRIRVVKPGYTSWEQSVELVSNRPVSLRARLKPENSAAGAGISAKPHHNTALAVAPLPATMADGRAEAQDFREVEARLRDFITAYLNRDLTRMDQVAHLSERNRRLLQHLFINYKTIVVRVTNHSVSGTNARAVVQIERLVRNNGDEVQPGDDWKQASVTLAKEDGQWGKIEW